MRHEIWRYFGVLVVGSLCAAPTLAAGQHPEDRGHDPVNLMPPEGDAHRLDAGDDLHERLPHEGDLGRSQRLPAPVATALVFDSTESA